MNKIYTHKKTFLQRRKSEYKKRCRRKIHRIFKQCQGQNAGFLIQNLNVLSDRIIWESKDFLSRKDFRELDGYIHQKCRSFLKRLHPKKNWKWIQQRYFKETPSLKKKAYIFYDPINKQVLTKMNQKLDL